MSNLTAKQLRLQKYNNIILNNLQKFKAGASMTRADFVNLFNIPNIAITGSYKQIHRSNLKLVSVQVEINQLMRENGLYLQTEDYYTIFKVAPLKKTKSTVIRYSAEVDINHYCTSRLEAKLKQRVKAGTWGTYQNVFPSTIAKMGNKPITQRHATTINRVKSI